MKRDGSTEERATGTGPLGDSLRAGKAPAVLSSFIELLGFWGDVYQTHKCERRFLEFSSGVPFAQWRHVVNSLKVDLTNRPLRGECQICLDGA